MFNGYGAKLILSEDLEHSNFIVYIYNKRRLSAAI